MSDPNKVFDIGPVKRIKQLVLNPNQALAVVIQTDQVLLKNSMQKSPELSGDF
jgi:hypothetical protein